MAKRDNSVKQSKTAADAIAAPGASMTTDAMEQRVIAFAEQLGRIVGTVQGKTEGWMDRDALNKQISGVRDSAVELLEQLKTSVSKAATGAGKSVAAAAQPKSKGRSGGVVDAPGKKHRKPMPADPRGVAADAKRSAMRSSQASMKTTKLRGRG